MAIAESRSCEPRYSVLVSGEVFSSIESSPNDSAIIVAQLGPHWTPFAKYLCLRSGCSPGNPEILEHVGSGDESKSRSSDSG